MLKGKIIKVIWIMVGCRAIIAKMNKNSHVLRLKYLGINTYNEPIIYMREDCHICRSEGFGANTRVEATLGGRSLIATLNTIESDLLDHGEVGLSHYAWNFLQASPGDQLYLAHPKPPESLSYIRSKLYGNYLNNDAIEIIVNDLLAGRLSDIHITMFLSSTVGNRMNEKEIYDLTRAMVETGQRIHWPDDTIVDKHCVGGLPGNRTTLIVVPIVAAFGLRIPKTSSRAITSPAGTADTMEIFAPVDLDIKTMQTVVEKENGCIIWGGAVDLSPADDLLIRIERTMNIDSEGQMVASILSKKIAAGSNHLLIDIPIGPTAKVRSPESAELLKGLLESIASAFSIQTRVLFTDGTKPVGRGIGPALEAKDILDVLTCSPTAPKDLRERALKIAGELIEFSPNVPKGQGVILATELLTNGKAFEKFQAICKAQGGGEIMIPTSHHTHVVTSLKAGRITDINNRHVAFLAKLAGAPKSKAAGLELLTTVGDKIEIKQPLFAIHAENLGQMNYALAFLAQGHEIFHIEEGL